MVNIIEKLKGITVLFTVLLVFGIAGVASASELTQEQKEEYHKQYIDIVEEVMETHPGTILEVVPLNEFAEEDWVEPKEFRKLAIKRANMVFTESKKSSPELSTEITTMSTTQATKSKSFKASGTTASISITGSFTTIYNDIIDRQVFGSVNSITSRSTSIGTWTQTGYTPQRLDTSRTYGITVGGKYKLNGITTSHNVYVEFYCSSTGGVS